VQTRVRSIPLAIDVGHSSEFLAMISGQFLVDGRQVFLCKQFKKFAHLRPAFRPAFAIWSGVGKSEIPSVPP